jgi:Domain of unknown function (DUF4193)
LEQDQLDPEKVEDLAEDELEGDDDLENDDSDEEEEEEDDDGVVEEEEEEEGDQASLDELLAQRAAGRRGGDDADDNDDIMELSSEPVEPVAQTIPTKVTPVKAEEEFVCKSCHLVKPKVQLADPKRGYCRDCV